MRFRDKNPNTAALVKTLAAQPQAPVWRALAEALNRPRQGLSEVPLSRIERAHGKVLVVPGTVLGTGTVTKKHTVAALRFSATARQKIEAAGGSCISIEEAAKHKPADLRILG